MSSGMTFPLYGISSGRITSLKGEVSYLYKISHADLSQKDHLDIELFYQEFHGTIKSFKEECFYKFFYIKDELYINTNDEGVLNLIPCLSIIKNPLSILFSECDVFTDLEFYEDYFVLGHRYCRILNFYELPSIISANFLEEFGDCVFNLKKIDPIKAKQKLNLKRKLHFSLSQEQLRNIESEKAFFQNENLLEEVMTGEEVVFNFEGWLVVDADSLVELNIKTKELYLKAKVKDFKLFSEGRALGFFFSSLLPGVRPLMERSHLVPGKFMLGMIPFCFESLFDSGIMIHSRSNRKIFFNLFHPENQNYNLLITGSSGQGKSMIANNILFEEVNKNTKAVVLDFGNSFKKTTEYLGGKSIEETFNPLQFKSTTYLKNFVLSIVDASFFKLEDIGRLFHVLEGMCENELSNIDIFIDSLRLHFPKIEYYFFELKPFFSNENIKLENILYCDLGKYPENIKAPLIIFLIEYFKNLEGKKVFIFDECWNLLLNHAEYIAECFRTFRKHEASAIAISQNLEDFLGTNLGRVVFQNTYFKFLFRQSTETDLLTDFQKEQLDSVTSKKGVYSEFLLLSDNYQKVCRFYPDSLKFYLFNSDKTENLIFERFVFDRQDILDYREIFHHYLNLKIGESFHG